MSRTPRPQASKGSEKWVQQLVNDRPALLSKEVAAAFGIAGDIDWLSPLEGDDYAEYRDAAFARRLGLKLKVPLADFWPIGGPRWDALGLSNDGTAILVEAKAHIPEMNSPPSDATSKGSIAKIAAALEQTRRYLNVTSSADWASCFYQYTNRLAHLYFLSVVNALPTKLVFLCFVGDEQMEGPRTREEWEGAITLLESFLGVRRHKLSRHVAHVFMSVPF